MVIRLANVCFVPKADISSQLSFVLCNALFSQRSMPGINAVARAFLLSTEGGELCSDVMVSNITDDPEYWRKRAEEARTLAEQMAEARTKSLMLGIAASYEKIAKWAEQRRDGPR
jgi:hypothetical protein